MDALSMEYLPRRTRQGPPCSLTLTPSLAPRQVKFASMLLDSNTHTIPASDHDFCNMGDQSAVANMLCQPILYINHFGGPRGHKRWHFPPHRQFSLRPCLFPTDAAGC
jgi:hypothetical protein